MGCRRVWLCGDMRGWPSEKAWAADDGVSLELKRISPRLPSSLVRQGTKALKRTGGAGPRRLDSACPIRTSSCETSGPVNTSSGNLSEPLATSARHLRWGPLISRPPPTTSFNTCSRHLSSRTTSSNLLSRLLLGLLAQLLLGPPLNTFSRHRRVQKRPQLSEW